LASAETIRKTVACRLIVVGGHTRSIGKTQLVCDIIAALPEAVWLAGKITQYGHGLCAQNGEECDCAPTEHVAALDWEEVTLPLTRGGADSARFLRAGAKRAFWLRTKQGYLAEGMPLLREALARIYREAEYADGDECGGSKLTLGGQRNVEQNCGDQSSGINPLLQNQGLNVIVESNSLMQFVRPSLYITVLDAAREDFKDSARQMLDRADVFVFRRGLEDEGVTRRPWLQLGAQLLRDKPTLLQREGEPLPQPLFQLVKRILETEPSVSL